MNIKALQAFNAVVQEGTVSSAAKLLNLSQPAVSRLIAVLEAELRLTLFKRERQRLHLTDEGVAFDREARRILAGLQEIPRIADEIRAHRLKHLRVVTMPRAALSVMAPAMARFTKKHPSVKVSLDIRSHRDIESWINGREYDLGFGNVPIAHRAATSTPLARAALEVLMPTDHPFCKKEVITPEDLRCETLIQQFPGMLLRKQTDALFEAHEVKIEQEILTGSSQMAQHLVANGAGLTIIDRLSMLAMDDRRVTTRPLNPTRWVAFGVIRHRSDDPDPMVEALTSLLRDEIEIRAAEGSIIPVGPGGERLVD